MPSEAFEMMRSPIRQKEKAAFRNTVQPLDKMHRQRIAREEGADHAMVEGLDTSWGATEDD